MVQGGIGVLNDGRWLTGLQAYAYDVNDSGADAVVEAASLCAADIMFVGVSYLDHIVSATGERGPKLLYNSVRQHHGVEAYVRPQASRYPSDLVPPVSDDSGADGEAAYNAARAVAEPRGIEVVPWILSLTQPVALRSPAYGIVNVEGDIVPGWLCPSQPSTADFLEGLIADVIDRFHPPAIFLDGIRFPGPVAHGIADVFTCFCEVCLESARSQGLRLAESRSTLRSLVGALQSEPAATARAGTEALATSLGTLRAVARHPEILDWAEFRHRAIERLVARVAAVTRGKTDLWLDVWPPSYGWILGQDLARLAPYGSWTKPFTYHRWGGGADMPRIMEGVTTNPEALQALYEVFRTFFGFAGPETFDEFKRRGLDAAWVTTETALAGSLLGGRSRLAAGLQLWQMGPEGVREALDYAMRAKPDGVFFHCFGWTTHDEFKAAGDWVREHGLARRQAAPLPGGRRSGS
jgi:hypothetical protein